MHTASFFKYDYVKLVLSALASSTRLARASGGGRVRLFLDRSFRKAKLNRVARCVPVV
jgi:hypothetical protein